MRKSGLVAAALAALFFTISPAIVYAQASPKPDAKAVADACAKAKAKKGDKVDVKVVGADKKEVVVKAECTS